jgi:Protein of unknown function (DUF3631)
MEPTMPLPTDVKDRAKCVKRMRSLHAAMGSSNANEAEAARQKLLKFLTDYNLTWNHMVEILIQPDDPPKPQQPPPRSKGSNYNVLNLVDGLLEKYVGFTPAQRMATALWTLHSYVFDQYDVTPRLALLSPARRCGKTTLLLLLETLVNQADRIDNVSAAAIYHMLGEALLTPTILLDEGDNLGLLNDPVLRTVMNSGHRRGGYIRRMGARYPTFAPLAVAAIGLLPLPLMDRCVIINLVRRPLDAPPLLRLNISDIEFIDAMEHLRMEIRKWAQNCKLDQDPPMPANLVDRAADNWRILFAIADDLGRGEEARAAALELNAGRTDDDIAILAMYDIREIFNAQRTDRLSSKDLITALHNTENGMWLEYRGNNDNEPARALTQPALARLLRPFGIQPRTVWSLGGRDQRGPSLRGYYREQFEKAWASYCTRRSNTPPHRHTTQSLPKPKTKPKSKPKSKTKKRRK